MEGVEGVCLGGLGPLGGEGSRWVAGWRGRDGPERGLGEREGFSFLFSKSFFSFVYFRKPLLANCFEPAPTKVEF
jgi:hypothetical protein